VIKIKPFYYDDAIDTCSVDPHEALKALEEQAPEVLRKHVFKEAYSGESLMRVKSITPTPEQILARLKELRGEGRDDFDQGVIEDARDSIYYRGASDALDNAVSEIEEMIGGGE
jgi:hypothetical protein